VRVGTKATMGDDGDGDERKQPHLKPQDASTVDASKLTALSPEVVSFPFLLNEPSIAVALVSMLESSQSIKGISPFCCLLLTRISMPLLVAMLICV
jgi:hypothetical protein